MKKSSLFIIGFLILVTIAKGEYWKRINVNIPVGEITAQAINSKGDIFFISMMSSAESSNRADNLNHIWKMPHNSQIPIDCYSTSDTIAKIFVTKDDVLLAFIKTLSENTNYIYDDYDGFFWRNELFCKAILRSSDDGSNWVRSKMEIDGDLSISESKNGTLFLTGVAFADHFKGSKSLYKSIDGGASWNNIPWNYSNIHFFYCLKDDKLLIKTDSTAFLSSNSGKTWDTIQAFEKHLKRKNKIIELENGLFYDEYLGFSSDNGCSWFSNRTLKYDTLISKIVLMDDKEVFCISKKGALYRSLDFGQNWEYLLVLKVLLDSSDEKLYDNIIGLMNLEQNLYVFKKYSTNDNKAFNLYRYDLQTNTLINNFGNLSDSTVYSLHDVNYNQNNFLIQVEYEHLKLLSLKPKKVIQDFYILNPWLDIYDIFVAPDTTVCLNLRLKREENSSFISVNKGFTWNKIKNYMILFWGPQNEIYYAFNNFLYVSNDKGKTFKKTGNQIPRLLTGSYIWGAYLPNGNIYLTDAHENLCFSSDKGETWNYSWLYYCDYLPSFKYRAPNDIYVMFEYALYHSSDAGLTWQIIYFASDFGCHFAIHPDGDIFVADGYIHHSTNNGKTWEKIYIEGNHDFLSYISICNDDNIFVGTFLSTDKGKTWINQGTYGNVCLGNDIYSVNNYDFYVYKFIKQPDAVTNSNESSNYFPISPNPAFDNITINVGTQHVVSEQIKIYDVFGQEEHPPTPSYKEGEIRVDVSALPAGVYFVRVGDKVSKFIKI